MAKRLLTAPNGVNWEEAFNKNIRERLSEHADKAWQIADKFCQHGLALNCVMILERGLQKGRSEAAIAKLEEIWRDGVETPAIPKLEEMSAFQNETLANCFHIADLALTGPFRM